jgi:hypothetical protein
MEHQFYDFHSLVMPSLLEIKDRLWRNRRPKTDADVKAFYADLKSIEKECVADWNRNSQPEISRVNPVYWGNAINIIPGETFTPAKIYLVDSSTRFGLHKIPPFTVHAFSFRGFVPDRGNKTDKNYFSYVQSHLTCDDKTGDRASTIINLRIKDGMIVGQIPQYAPKVCLVYANINQSSDRMVFMLRPRHRLSNKLYGAYCLSVMSMLVKRVGGDVDFDMWNELDSEHKDVYRKSMVVTDTMLALKKDRPTRFLTNIDRIHWHAPAMVA